MIAASPFSAETCVLTVNMSAESTAYRREILQLYDKSWLI